MADKSDERPVSPANSSGVSRRGFLKGMGVAAVTTEVLLGCAPPSKQTAPVAEEEAHPSAPISGPTQIMLKVNGQERTVTVEPRTTLLSALRDRLEPAVTGPKLVCNVGTCGACTVMLDKKIVYGCSVLAVDAVGKSITTVEGIGTPEHMHPVQAAFVEKDAMMCGFCTSGFVTTVTNLLDKNPNPSPEQIREGCKGNFCRCGTYPHIFAAVTAAAQNKNGSHA